MISPNLLLLNEVTFVNENTNAELIKIKYQLRQLNNSKIL